MSDEFIVIMLDLKNNRVRGHESKLRISKVM